MPVGAIAAGIGALGSVAGSALSASEQKKAAEKNAKAAQSDTAMQLAWQKQLRGEGGSPTFLPFYTGTTEANTLWPKTMQAWQALSGTSAADQVKQYTEAAQPYLANLQGTVGDVMSGEWGRKRSASAEPVYSARMAAAETPRSSLIGATNQRLNALKTQNALAGIKTGSGTARDEMAARLAANDQAAQLVAQAKLQNAAQQYDIDQQNASEILSMALQSPQLAQQVLSLMQFPETAVAQSQANRMALFEPFTRRESFNAIQSTVPQYQATVPVGAALAQSIGTGASSVLGQIQQQSDYEKLLKAISQSGWGTSEA